MSLCAHHHFCGLDGGADPRQGLCILHTGDPGKDRQIFSKALEAHRHTKGNDFTLIVFPEKVNGEMFDFGRPVKFDDATFLDDVEFRATIFNEVAFFSGAKFKKKADFTGAQFAAEARFYGASFTSDATFMLATFADQADFLGAKFVQTALFTEATFIKVVNFMGAVFSGTALFNRAKFLGGALFRASFNGSVAFDGTLFRGHTLFAPFKQGTPIFSGIDVDFRRSIIDPPEAIAFREADLQKCRFLDTDLHKAEMTGVIWPRSPSRFSNFIPGLPGRTGIFDDTSVPEKLPDRPWDRIERIYRELKQNYEDRCDYERAGDFHYGEKEMRRLNPSTPVILRLVLTLYWLLSGYGERYLRPLFWVGGLLALSTIGYITFGLRLKPDQGGGFLTLTNLWDWLLAFDYSLRVMTLLRPDSLVPIGCSRFINTAQSLLGPALLALLALALRQRLRR